VRRNDAEESANAGNKKIENKKFEIRKKKVSKSSYITNKPSCLKII
jgi:hypothetical protein